MGQQECLEWLKEQSKECPDRWFRIRDIQEGLKQKGLGNGSIKNVGSHCLKLTQCNDIQMRGVGVWKHYKEFKAHK